MTGLIGKYRFWCYLILFVSLRFIATPTCMLHTYQIDTQFEVLNSPHIFWVGSNHKQTWSGNRMYDIPCTICTFRVVLSFDLTVLSVMEAFRYTTSYLFNENTSNSYGGLYIGYLFRFTSNSQSNPMWRTSSWDNRGDCSISSSWNFPDCGTKKLVYGVLHLGPFDDHCLM